MKPHDAVTDLPFRKEEKLERNQIWKKIEKTQKWGKAKSKPGVVVASWTF